MGVIGSSEQFGVPTKELNAGSTVVCASPDNSVGARYARNDLRAAVELFADVQRRRIATGERIRAVLQGRDSKPIKAAAGISPKADLTLSFDGVCAGEFLVPSPFLQRAFARYVVEEKELVREVTAVVVVHPAWAWLKDVRGAGPVLSARLLARLDITRANTPSAFWSYCGLSTVPGSGFRCPECGLTIARPLGRQPNIRHKSPDSQQECVGAFLDVEYAGPRVAQPRPRRGESRSYDAEAKRVCYLIGISFIRQGGKFKSYYKDERARLDESRPEWAKARKHLTAMRKTEKRFLALLWTAWRQAVDLPVVPLARDSSTWPAYPRYNPWDMIG